MNLEALRDRLLSDVETATASVAGNVSRNLVRKGTKFVADPELFLCDLVRKRVERQGGAAGSGLPLTPFLGASERYLYEKLRQRIEEQGRRRGYARPVATPGSADVSQAAGSRSKTARRITPLTPQQAFATNGFCVFPNLIPEPERSALAAKLKSQLGVVGQQRRSTIDAVNRLPAGQELVFDERILRTVREVLGQDIRFLQVSDLQYNQDHLGWHRDGAYLTNANPRTSDWDERVDPYRVIKIILYLESDHAGMGVLPGSQRTPALMNQKRLAELEAEGRHLILPKGENANRRIELEDPDQPVVWCASPGDALVFDLRMFHCGRRVVNNEVKMGEGNKLTFSLVFGRDGLHAHRFYSYFRYLRTDLSYSAMPDALRAKIEQKGLAPSAGWGDHFEAHPEDGEGTRRGRRPKEPQKAKPTATN